MPMNMRNHIAQAGEVHFVGLLNVTHDALDQQDRIHQVSLFCQRKIAHFTHVSIQNNATKTRESASLVAANQYHPAQRILVENVATRVFANNTFLNHYRLSFCWKMFDSTAIYNAW